MMSRIETAAILILVRNLVADLATGTQVTLRGSRDDDALLHIAAELAKKGEHELAEKLKFHALRINSLHLTLLRKRL